MYKIGDCVKFLDDVGKGTVLEIKGDALLIADADGFEEWYHSKELAPCKPFPTASATPIIAQTKALKVDPKQHRLLNKTVGFVNEPGMGVVVAAEKELIKVRNESGFEDWYAASDIIVYDEGARQLENLDEMALRSVLKQELKQPKRKPGTSAKGRVITAVEIDLHIHELLENTAGMSKHDLFTYQMNYAKNQIERCRTSGDKRIVLIHGKGKGRLREALWNLLQGMDKLDFYDASFAKYGGGAIEVKLW
ncbi:MAG: Smr/MutS family protein [Schleiferiaceae bacterium]|nr:Smr/MutS family protein [Schleiferiaceae bacterium]